MRTRARWLALAIIGGMALAPAAVRAQGGLDVAPSRPIVPLPIYSSRPEAGGFYGAVQFIMFRQTRDLAPQVVARRGFYDVDGSVQRDLGGTFVVPPGGGTPVFVPGPAGAPGTFLGSGSPALLVSDLNSSMTYAPGMAFTLGYRFSDGSAFEARFKHVFNTEYNAGADIIPPGFAVGPQLADSFLTADVVNFPVEYAGQNQELALGNPGATYGIWNAAQSMTIAFTQRYDQYDWSYRQVLRADDISRTHISFGGRFAWIWERFEWRTVSADFTGASGPDDVAIYSNIVSNRMYGPTIGCQHEWYLGRGFALTILADAAAYVNIVKERARYERGDKFTAAKKSVTEYTFVPGLNGELHLTWYPTEGIQLRMGWNAMTFWNTVQASNPISFNFGRINPVWERKAIRYFDGIEMGLAISF